MGKFTESFKKILTCPHCSEQISVVVDQDVNWGTRLCAEEFVEEQRAKRVASGAPPSDDQVQQTFERSLDSQQKLVLATVKSAGLLEPFLAAFEASHGSKPQNIAKTLLPWLKMARGKMISREVMEVFKEQFGGSIDFLAHQSIGAVISNGEIVQFLPCLIVGDAPAGSFKIGRTGAQLADQTREWIRTKYGYVAKSGAMLAELRRRNYGEFCKPIQ